MYLLFVLLISLIFPQFENKAQLIELDVELINLGSQSTQNVDIIVSTNDPYITLIDSTDFLAAVSASNTIMISSPFTFQVANYVPDQHVAQFLFTISDDQGNVWTSPLSLTINAPILSDLGFLIDDALGNANGKLESGETVDIIIEVENIGNADIDNLNAFLSLSCKVYFMSSKNIFLNSSPSKKILFLFIFLNFLKKNFPKVLLPLPEIPVIQITTVLL